MYDENLLDEYLDEWGCPEITEENQNDIINKEIDNEESND